MIVKKCESCTKEFEVIPARQATAKFCSRSCYGAWKRQNFAGANNPNFRGGHSKKCLHCSKEFWVIPATQKRKFCSKPCADIGGFRYTGETHPNYREEARRKNRGGSHHKWVNAVLSRDQATCQHCGADDVELHAHHIKSYRDNPELRFEISNGLTLCYKCHWEVHTAQNEKAVNSGNILPSNVEDNPEPSIDGNIIEGVTTRGRASRKWVGKCDWCGKVISKRLSDIKGKTKLFCGYSCLGYSNAQRRAELKATAVISSKSPAPERDDIV